MYEFDIFEVIIIAFVAGGLSYRYGWSTGWQDAMDIITGKPK